MRETFTKIICENPDDLVTRRVFADWLSEQPDLASQERGEFIAIQIELSQPISTPRRQLLRQRESELLTKYRNDWLTPLRELGVKGCLSFRNGFVEQLQAPVIDYLDWHAKGLLKLAPITTLILGQLSEPSVELLASEGALLTIQSLVLRGYSSDLRNCLSGLLNLSLPSLTRLVLDRLSLDDHMVARLAAWPGLGQLRELSLRSCGLTPTRLNTLLQSPQLDSNTGPLTLQRLHLEGNPDLQQHPFFSGTSLVAKTLNHPNAHPLREALIHSGIHQCPSRFAATMENPGREGNDLLIAALIHAEPRNRLRAAEMLATRTLEVENLPSLVRRSFDPGLSTPLAQVLLKTAAKAAPLVQRWVKSLTKQNDVLISLPRTLRNECSSLPTQVMQSFAELCRRRLHWRMSHGRQEAVAVPQEVRGVEDLIALLQQVGDLAVESGLRHRADRFATPLHRDLLRGKEYAFLVDWLVRLLMKHG
jgi:uncharacterized protein (TIGR02996 family)